MANNDKLKEIISNLQKLIDLAVGVKDSELYPVSFFSNTFDLLQKVQNSFYTLEAEQVEMFAFQMKKHQDLITSIHQQMRNIESIPESKVSSETPTPAAAPEQVIPPIKDYDILQNIDTPNIKPADTKEEKPRKRLIFSKIIGKNNVQAPPENKSATTVTPTPTPVIIPDENVAETKPEEASIVQEKIRITEEKPYKAENSISHQPRSLNDVIEKNRLSDLRKAFNLNDRFRYQRELFGGKEDVMSTVMAELNSHRSLEESLTYLSEELGWDVADPTVSDFIKKLEIRFL